MIASLSAAGYLILGLPHPQSCFFEQPQFEGLLSDNFFQLLGLAAQILDLLGGGRTGCITGKPTLASLQKLLRPAVVQALDDPFAPAEFSNAGFAAQAIQHNADLLFSRIMLPRRSADVLYNLF